MGRYLRTAVNTCALLTSRSYAGARHGHAVLPVSAAAVSAQRTVMNLPRLAKLTSSTSSYHRQQIVRYNTLVSPALAGDHSNLSATTVIKTELDSSHRCLEVTWNDGERTSYPYIWLRDNCQCSTCFHSTTLARRLLFHNIDFNVMPINVETHSATQEVVITWSDDHRSVFRYGWLLARSFRYTEQCLRARWNGRAAKLWKNNLADNVLNVKFDEFLLDDRQLYHWLTALEETGFALLTGVPAEPGQLHRIAARVAYLRKTLLGETSFENAAQETSPEACHTVSSQELHNDLTHYYNLPGMKMVHCINAGADCDLGNKQVTQFVDGFQAAQQLKTKYPDQFRLLSSVKMDFFSIGHDAIMMSRHPTIKLDEAGEVVQIHYSTRFRDTFCRQSLEDVEPLYRALKTFAGLIYDPQNLVEMQLKTGVVYCFNNWRVLHGRKAFQLTPGSEPVFERGYIDWDELHSKRRILKLQFGISDEDY